MTDIKQTFFSDPKYKIPAVVSVFHYLAVVVFILWGNYGNEVRCGSPLQFVIVPAIGTAAFLVMYDRQNGKSWFTTKSKIVNFVLAALPSIFYLIYLVRSLTESFRQSFGY